LAGTIDFHSIAFGIDQPSESGAVIHPLLHFRPRDAKAVGAGMEFDSEIGAQAPECAGFHGVQFKDAGFFEVPQIVHRSSATSRASPADPSRRYGFACP
jgi:hypothetical protein